MIKFGVAVLTLTMALGGALTATAAPAAADGPAPIKLSKPVAQALGEAQKQAALKNYQGELDGANQAMAVATTDDEKFQITQFLLQANAAMHNDAAAADNLDALIASGKLTSDVMQSREKAACQIRYNLKDWPKATKACSSYAAKYNDRELGYVTCQIYYQQKDWQNTATCLRTAFKTDPAPAKNMLRMAEQAYSKLNDKDNIVWAQEQIVQHYPTDKDYWNILLSNVQRKLRTDRHFDLDILRLRIATGVIEGPSEIIDLANTALDLGYPGEAKTALEHALAAGQIGAGASKANDMALLAKARAQAALDLKGLAKDEAESRKSPKGEPDLRLGEALASHGRFDQGIAAMQRGIAKGSLKDKVEAQLRLGIAQYNAGKPQDALQTLEAAVGASPYATIAHLWTIHIRSTITAAAPAAPATPAAG